MIGESGWSLEILHKDRSLSSCPSVVGFGLVKKQRKSFVGDPEVFDRNLSKEKVRDYIKESVNYS